MTTSADPPRSKGMAMIASYRAARLNQRLVLRSSLRQAHLALRQGREIRQAEPDPVRDPPPSPPEDRVSPSVEIASVFAGLVSLAVSEREEEAADAWTPTAIPSYAAADTIDAGRADHGNESAPHPEGTSEIIGELPTEPSPPPPETISVAEVPLTAFPDTAPAAAQQVPPALPSDPPLAEIGFGPGMLIRLSQLGLHTTGDLAQADAAQLRTALGDISRLVDVETWINNARQTVAGRP